jgi:signal-transduction protein with cAMP-binding, CBS, and nucleotidyltransferase domain
MAGMYDVIMDLPLFRGLSHAQVSSFLEKTHIEFINYNRGDMIRDHHQSEDALIFVISGKVRMEWVNDDMSLKVCYVSGCGTVHGAFNLFGMVRENPYSMRAMERTSVLRVSKNQYMDLLVLNPVYLLNFLNMLSLKCQRASEALAAERDASVLTKMQTYVLSLTPTTCESVEIEYDLVALATHTNLSPEIVVRQLDCIRDMGIAEVTNDKVIITSRRDFIKARLGAI